MKTITAAEIVNVNSGKVLLDAAQARARLHNLAPVEVGKDGAGIYEVRAPIQFKRGERFGFDGEIGKDGSYTDPRAEERARAADAEKQSLAVKTAADEARAALASDLRAKLAPAIEDMPVKFRAALNQALDEVLGSATNLV